MVDMEAHMPWNALTTRFASWQTALLQTATGFSDKEQERKYVLWNTVGAARRRLDVAFLLLQSLGNFALTYRFWQQDNTEVPATVRTPEPNPCRSNQVRVVFLLLAP